MEDLLVLERPIEHVGAAPGPSYRDGSDLTTVSGALTSPAGLDELTLAVPQGLGPAAEPSCG